jgi:hypothetical protein
LFKRYISLLLFALFAPAAGYAESQSDVLLKTVAFALTANDETKVEPLDQGDCVFRIINPAAGATEIPQCSSLPATPS